MTARRSSYQIRPPPKEVFPESTLSPGGLQLTTLFWDMGILFHRGSHAGARVGNSFEVFGCIVTHVSNRSNTPPHPSYWRPIPSPGGSFSLSGPITTFTSAVRQGAAHRTHGRPYSFPRNLSSQAPLASHAHAREASNESFRGGRAHLSIKHDIDQLAASDDAVRHASEEGLGPVQNGIAPGSSIDRQAGYYRGAGCPSTPMGNSAPQGHNRALQIQNATTQSTGHDRTAAGVGRISIDATAAGVALALPAEHPMPVVQPI
ncbi:hypothetical protein F5148DRAFT_816986 [Russula earlei]|uniref:Uncharacterized protein n=1 Tax=Russula earlei TaxID=71964 RepID=A0ACC0UD97_9AGAM|nr:hypothetical protein F5148DRAFT_816986 [Russula earlei]